MFNAAIPLDRYAKYLSTTLASPFEFEQNHEFFNTIDRQM